MILQHLQHDHVALAACASACDMFHDVVFDLLFPGPMTLTDTSEFNCFTSAVCGTPDIARSLRKISFWACSRSAARTAGTSPDTVKIFHALQYMNVLEELSIAGFVRLKLSNKLVEFMDELRCQTVKLPIKAFSISSCLRGGIDGVVLCRILLGCPNLSFFQYEEPAVWLPGRRPHWPPRPNRLHHNVSSAETIKTINTLILGISNISCYMPPRDCTEPVIEWLAEVADSSQLTNIATMLPTTSVQRLVQYTVRGATATEADIERKCTMDILKSAGSKLISLRLSTFLHDKVAVNCQWKDAQPLSGLLEYNTSLQEVFINISLVHHRKKDKTMLSDSLPSVLTTVTLTHSHLKRVLISIELNNWDRLELNDPGEKVWQSKGKINMQISRLLTEHSNLQVRLGVLWEGAHTTDPDQLPSIVAQLRESLPTGKAGTQLDVIVTEERAEYERRMEPVWFMEHTLPTRRISK